MMAHLDLVRSAIIAGMILVIVLSIHFMTNRASLENRLTQDMQQRASTVMQIIEAELRFLEMIEEAEPDSIFFRVIDVPETTGYDFVEIKRSDELLVVRYLDGSMTEVDSLAYNVNLTFLEFGQENAKMFPVSLRIESRTEDYYQDHQRRFPGFAQKSFFLRNLE